MADKVHCIKKTLRLTPEESKMWIVNTFSDKFFKVIFAILYRRLIP